MRALNRAKPVTYLTILFYYAFGLPIAVYLGFYQNMSLVGFWIGYIIAMFLVDLAVAYVVITCPWKVEQVQSVQTAKAQQEAERKNSLARSRAGSSASS